jgi:hypothetical protein
MFITSPELLKEARSRYRMILELIEGLYQQWRANGDPDGYFEIQITWLAMDLTALEIQHSRSVRVDPEHADELHQLYARIEDHRRALGRA